jgi:hypothetical protein
LGKGEWGCFPHLAETLKKRMPIALLSYPLKKRRIVMGDKGGKKDKDKAKKQTDVKHKQSDKKKADKQPAKKV